MLTQAQRYRKFRVRTYSTVTMIGGFILLIYMGHVPLMLLIFFIQVPPPPSPSPPLSPVQNDGEWLGSTDDVP